MLCARLCRRQSPSSCWSSDLKRITAKILEVLRAVLSRIGFASAESLTTKKIELPIHKSALPSRDEGDREVSRQRSVGAGCPKALQGSTVEESLGARQVSRGAEGERVPEPYVTEIAEASAGQEPPIQEADGGSESGASSEGDGGERVGSVPWANVGEELIARDPIRHIRQRGGVESSVEKRPRAAVIDPPPVQRNTAGSPLGAQRSSSHGETRHEPVAPSTGPEGGEMSGGSAGDGGSAYPHNTGAGDPSVDRTSEHDDALQTAGLTFRADPHPRLDVQREPVAAASSPHGDDPTAADSGGDKFSTCPTGLPNADLGGQEALLEERWTASAGVRKSGSGELDQPQPEEESSKPAEGDAPTAADVSGVPCPRQPTPPVDAREYAVPCPDVVVVDLEYARWNNAVVEQLLLAGPSSEEGLLCVNARILARVFEEAGLGSITPEQAEQQFTTAVANVYQRRVLGDSARLRVLRRCTGDAPPDCAAFLAGSVLAAFRMQSDEELSGNAYYRRLAGLLECGMQGAHPIGFDPAVFESLWVFLSNWLREVHGRQLAMPKSSVGFRRFVALPLVHVPLRSLDIEKLPVFFSWAGYQPGARLRHDRLLADLTRWQQSSSRLTPTGADALRDHRSSAVAAQVSAELKGWDGSLCESVSRRSALVEIQFDVVQRSPVFFYLPRRPLGFPGVFEDGERVFEASDEGWYDPAQVRPNDGDLLESGFEWRSHWEGSDWTLRRPGELVIPFTPSSSYSGFLSSRHVLRGVRCSVLCRDNIVPTVKDYLSEVAQDLLCPVSHSLLPNGWSMFRDVSAHVHVEAPSGLEALEVDPNIELIVSGGLRIGRTWSWLTGAPPRIFASGMEGQDRITVNGASVGVGASGELLAGGIFHQPGEYLVEAGSHRRRIEMVRPQVSVQSGAERGESLDATRSRRIALPGGSWSLIGKFPNEVCYSHGEFFQGTIASCPFDPSWAVQVGSGPGAVVAVAAHPSLPRMLSLCGLTRQTRKLIEQWINIVYAAHIRHPRFVGLNGTAPDDGIVNVWRNYVTLAKEIKRSLKQRR